MLEKTHIAAVVREIKKLGVLHSQSMTFGSLSTNGTPDRYFDGRMRDLWIEFKRLTSIPRSGVVIGAYSDLQLEWMHRRWSSVNGANAWGIVGLPNKTVCIQDYPAAWKAGTPLNQAVSHKDAALIIWNHCNGSTLACKSEPVQIGSDSPGHSRIRSTRR